jgi:serine/threonine-protein kinase RsbW
VATVAVSFTPLPAHVRTARFIAASVARRAGLPENVLDEVRLAVSEACSLAVRTHRVHAPDVPVELRLTDDTDHFEVEVADAVPRSTTSDATGEVDLPLDLRDDEQFDTSIGAQLVDERALVDRFGAVGASDDASAGVDLRSRERIGLAVIMGLVDDVEVAHLEGGSVVRMRWPIGQPAQTPAASGGAGVR